MKKVSVYGIGNFGYAILKHLDKKASPDFLLSAYDRNQKAVRSLATNREHLYFHKGKKISERVVLAQNPRELLTNCDILIVAVTAGAIPEILKNIKRYLKPGLIIVNTAKALAGGSGRRISELIAKQLVGKKYTYAVLAGGTIAKDLFDHEPLGVNIACRSPRVLKELVDLFKSPNLFVYPTTDVCGIEYASAFKNVISILAGLTKGLGFSYGAETHIISRAAAEVEDLVVNKLGGQRTTFRLGSQAWGNDLWMSCTGNTRNREFGILVGSGREIKDALTEMSHSNKTVEGINTIKILSAIKQIKHYYILHLIDRLFQGKVTLLEFKELIFNNR